MNTRTTAGVVAILAGIGIALAGPANAGGDHKEWILHPVNGKGELKNGYNCISPDKHSSHFDEHGHPKHEAEGRVDKYDTEGLCTPSENPTTGTTTSTSSTTSVPTLTETTTNSSTTTHTSTPTDTETSTSPSKTATYVPTPMPTSTPKEVIKKPVAHNNQPPQLANTGSDDIVYVIVALVLILSGTALTIKSRKIEVIR